MPDVSFDNLLIISVDRGARAAAGRRAAAAAHPGRRAGDRRRHRRRPDRASAGCEVDLPVQILALFGLAFLLFLAGLEIDLMTLRGRSLRRRGGRLRHHPALWASASAAALHAVGWVQQPLLIAVALSATSLGLVVPVLKDAGQSDERRRAGGDRRAPPSPTSPRSSCCRSSSPASGGSAGAKVVLLVAFAALVGVTAVVVLRAGRSMRLGDLLVRLQDTTAEIRVRLAVVLLVAFVALADPVRAGEHPRRVPGRRGRQPGRPRLRVAPAPAHQARGDRLRLRRAGVLRQLAASGSTSPA